MATLSYHEQKNIEKSSVNFRKNSPISARISSVELKQVPL